jgi:hypothetical protein
MDEERKIKYYLKRFNRDDAYAEGDDGDHIGVLGHMEAGVVYEEEGERETIYVDGYWNDGEPRVYEYESGAASAADGWMLD